ncbi:hypothetical protein [Endozoicomonas sp. GU-1]|uniref:protein kinase domain-containing protein n=1 Tax=Endozoicomonas sp. GU-1 TaxID=3009078 RepID=UPI0022B35823|nr:hypothetical protein [Endozoicomonas sp. GU-1]WBA82348.1 hypothetical protein O2T12_04145 [Endozoicomonas sp. GU-1]WBA85285.1 hypothetical protein O3276_18840 [Endozoicomonas sp. GU-1]
MPDSALLSYWLPSLQTCILEGRRISPESLKELDKTVKASEAWYKDIFLDVLCHQSCKDAGELFALLKEQEPYDTSEFEFDISELEPFQKPFKLERQYQEDELLKETDTKEIYRSDHQLVKAWTNVRPTSKDPEQGYRSLHFCNTLTSLKSLSPEYLPEIYDFGLSARSGSLFLVTEFIEGDTWEIAAAIYSEEQKKLLINNLISAITHLHGLNLYHGDLHPENLLITNPENPQVKLLDLPDFSVFGEESFNHRYSPENIDGCTAQVRDNFAVMRMTCELLGIEWGQESELFSEISAAVYRENEDLDAGFKSLERFVEALHPDASSVDENIEIIEIGLKKVSEDITIYPDNGQLFVNIEPSNKDPNDARVLLTGIGGSVSLIYKPQEEAFVVGFPPRNRDSISRKDIDTSDIELPFAVRVVDSYRYDLADLNKRIGDFEGFAKIVSAKLKPDAEPEDFDDTSDIVKGGLAELFLSDLNSSEYDQEHGSSRFDDSDPESTTFHTSDLWKAVLDTETMALPFIEVSGDTFEPKSDGSKLALPYVPEVSEGLEKFRNGDEVEALILNEEHEDIWIGDVNLKKSKSSEVHLKKATPKAKALSDGDTVYFRTKMDRSSYKKRKNALKRILDCAFRSIRPPIPLTFGHRFRKYPATHSGNIRPPPS